jgi:hypothetical protein
VSQAATTQQANDVVTEECAAAASFPSSRAPAADANTTNAGTNGCFFLSAA